LRFENNTSREAAKSAKADTKNAHFFIFPFAVIIALIAPSRLALASGRGFHTGAV